jgi:predicted HNH restriction endonuclease
MECATPFAAVCPNCHREIHHGLDGQAVNERLQTAVTRRETEITSDPPLP